MAVSRDQELTRIWNTDAPEGQAWICQEPGCDSWATLGGNAGYHADKLGHALPILGPITKELLRKSEEDVGTYELPVHEAADGRRFVYLCPYCFQPLAADDSTCNSTSHVGSDGSGVGQAIRSIDLATL